MDPVGALQLCFSIITKIVQAVDEAKANNRKCKTLGERVSILSNALKKLQISSANQQKVQETLTSLSEILNNALVLIESYNAKNWFMKAIQSNTANEEFRDINEQISRCVTDLQLDISIEILFNQEKDRSDEEEDRQNLRNILDKLTQQQGLLQQILDDQIKERISHEKALISVKKQLEKLNNKKEVTERSPSSENLTEISMSDLKMIQKIGAGSFGEVWKATWLDVTVAVKTLQPHHINDQLVTDFKEEVRIVSQLRHPNVVHLFGACTQDRENLAMIMEYYPGNLYKLIHVDKVGLELQAKMRLAYGIACGIQYLHRYNICHRDLKSANILLDATMTPKIADFGLSKVKNQSSKMNTMVGTSAWMAPELFDVDGASYTYKVDIYSFAIVLWEIISYKFPFDNYSNQTQIAFAVMKGVRPEIPKDCPSEVSKIMQSCWDTNPDNRPTAYEVVKLLHPLAPSEPSPVQYPIKHNPSPPTSNNNSNGPGLSKTPTSTTPLVTHQPKQAPMHDSKRKWDSYTISCLILGILIFLTGIAAAVTYPDDPTSIACGGVMAFLGIFGIPALVVLNGTCRSWKNTSSKWMIIVWSSYAIFFLFCIAGFVIGFGGIHPGGPIGVGILGAWVSLVSLVKARRWNRTPQSCC